MRIKMLLSSPEGHINTDSCLLIHHYFFLYTRKHQRIFISFLFIRASSDTHFCALPPHPPPSTSPQILKVVSIFRSMPSQEKTTVEIINRSEGLYNFDEQNFASLQCSAFLTSMGLIRLVLWSMVMKLDLAEPWTSKTCYCVPDLDGNPDNSQCVKLHTLGG